jgi:prepilin-type N-terminal cleavage/methylation domain-containing protein
MKRIEKGFTLIELLIVVAIIAILAAIAIPNFLAAQVRSKVSRAHADMRSIATGLESYRIDNNAYPWLTDIGSGPNNLPTNGWTWCGMPLSLSTPVSYISDANLWDPFPDIMSNSFQRSTFRYYDNKLLWYLRTNYSQNWISTQTWVGDWVYPTYRTGNSLFQPGNPQEWFLVSNGPDVNFQDWGPYDPTNGTVSNGDIERFGP